MARSAVKVTSKASKTRGSGAEMPDRRKQILDVATQLFYERGFSETSMQDIGEAVGLLKGSLYYHISAKEEMLFEVLRDLHSTSLELVRRIEHGTPEPLEQLRAYLIGLTTYAAHNAVRLAIFIRDFRFLPPEQQRQIIAERDVYTQAARRLIEEACALKQVSGDLCPKTAAMTAVSATSGVHEWYRPEGERPIQAIAEEIAGLVISGIRNFSKS